MVRPAKWPTLAALSPCAPGSTLFSRFSAGPQVTFPGDAGTPREHRARREILAVVWPTLQPEFSLNRRNLVRPRMLCLTSFAVAIVTLSDVRTPTLVIDVDAIARDRSLEQLVPVALTCAPASNTSHSSMRRNVSAATHVSLATPLPPLSVCRPSC